MPAGPAADGGLIRGDDDDDDDDDEDIVASSFLKNSGRFSCIRVMNFCFFSIFIVLNSFS